MIFNPTCRRFFSLCTLSTLVLLPTAAHADWISPIFATASSSIADTTEYKRTPDHVIDGSGLDIKGQHIKLPDTSGGYTMWLSAANDSAPSITFDLGRVVRVDQMHVWNYNEGYMDFTSRGVRDANLSFSISDPAGTTNSADNFTFARADGTDAYQGEDYAFSKVITARYIKFNIQSNYGDSTPFYGLSEVRFNEAMPTPEPTTWAMMAMGLAAVGIIGRKRKRDVEIA